MRLDQIFDQHEIVNLGSRVSNGDQLRWQRARRKQLIYHATSMALLGALQKGVDFPVGAVAASEEHIVGRYIASDKRLGYQQMHAEYMAIMETILHRPNGVPPKTVAVNVEPCENCYDFLTTQVEHGLEEVVFCVTRREIADRGLVKSHDKSILEYAWSKGMPIALTLVRDPVLVDANLALFDNTSRNTTTGEVAIDTEGLRNRLSELTGLPRPEPVVSQ